MADCEIAIGRQHSEEYGARKLKRNDTLIKSNKSLSHLRKLLHGDQ
jgi:hypothetical protein